MAIEDPETITKAEEATAGLRRGIERTRAIVSFYRKRLTILRDIGDSSTKDRPIFRFGEEDRARSDGTARKRSGD